MKKLLLLFSVATFSLPVFAGEPSLPIGLGVTSEPSLPAGIDSNPLELEPALPTGIIVNSEAVKNHQNKESNFLNWQKNLPFDLTGFVEAREGVRTQNDIYQKDTPLGELRAQLKVEKQLNKITAHLSADLVYDPVMDKYDIDLENGDGFLDLREANFSFSPTDNIDMKVGRQILTWGTGDLLFINDLFPKDWNSFFIGRDEEYLKAPSDSLKTSFYNDAFNLDVVYTPKFEGDRFIDGRRLSYYNGNTGSLAGRNNLISTNGRNSYFTEDELALRLNKIIGTHEIALYYYNGYWKTPEGYNSISTLYEYPKLQVFGGSIRVPIASGIANIEAGYYDSKDDNSGNNSLIRNSELRFLAGYEREILPEFTASVQYYLEHMKDYNAYKANLPAGSFAKDKNRHVITTRLTKLLMNQNLTLSLFNFYSPSDEDGYLRPKINYKIDDNWQIEAGANYFYGNHHQSFFGQFEKDSNIYAGLRYNF